MTLLSSVNLKEELHKIEVREESMLLKGNVLCQIRHEKGSVQCESGDIFLQIVMLILSHL
jgi:hypothetical protein